MSTADLPTEIQSMSADERISLAMKIWDSVDNDELSLSDEERRILDERLDAHLANPEEGESWESVKNDLRKKQ